ncbi:MAG: FAD-dependent tricarballylate dehydrogenase TcuA [Pseudomonadales bacterium]|nr:FAD-dependent tricarballylate dehydrogenase TcuA [Pseudomonadales bacterium]MBO6594709.1 FAD-dependent tricarballylate dehydrogenase TcuA [Pseudomonadales bacterium]MBO6658406.1 FAD-dependent tricarballylate dehydrogenase TcuA [Pseudomonadales bacterium]MBO6821732.1 FAD-dependent tricarballylate dehydrogenase TcuA [Pseudomonadales bacterium]
MKAEFDVIVIGAGHAGLTAAICAAEEGASVCVLEVAPRNLRGGNSRHTRNLRAMHEEPMHSLDGQYGYEEYWQDLIRVTGGQTDEPLARLTIQRSEDSIDWLKQHGVAFQPPLSGTLHLGRTNAFFLGGGKALMNALFQAAEDLGIHVMYETEDVSLKFEAGQFRSASFTRAAVSQHKESCQVEGRAIVVAAGGFEANLEWLAEAWGDAVLNFLVRGTPYNRGDILKQLLDAGAEKVGDVRQCHAVAIDGRAPKFDGGICSRIDCVPLGIVVNQAGERFYDEGEDFWPKRYAIWGRLVAEQNNQVAYTIIDDKAQGLFMPPVFPAVQSDSIEGLAQTLGLPPSQLCQTVEGFNQAVASGEFNHQDLDGCRTEGLAINKSHWARTIDQPPYRAYLLRPGITFTYLGVRVDERAMVQFENHQDSNVFAAGEIMAGNVLGEGYLAGIGMTIGSVFGRIAGKEAATLAVG